MGKHKFMVSLHFDHEDIQPESPTVDADMDLVIQDGRQIVVIPVDRCILLPTCPLLAKLCNTLPADPDHMDCACFRQRVTVTGVKLEAVKALVELIYKGICNLEQVSFEDVKIAATQLGFKGKGGLVMELRTTTQGEDQCEDLGGNGEPRNAVDDVTIRGEVENPDAENGAAGRSKNGSEGNVDGLPKEVGEVAEQEGVGQLDRRDVQGVRGNVQERIQEIVEEVPSSQDEFQGALEVDETASQSVRATSTPVAAGKSLVAHHDDLGPTFPSGNNAGETSRVEAPIEQIDENGNGESEAISEARARFSIGALMARKDIQGGFVDESAVGEQDMDLDHSLMEKTSESRIELGCGDQGPRSRSRSRSCASRVMNLLRGSARKRGVQQGFQKVGLHKGMLKKAINVLQKEKTQSRFVKVMQEMQDTKQREGLDKKSMQMQGAAQSNQVATNIGRGCRKCGKALRWAKCNLCVECEGVFHITCSARKFEGEGWVCQRCKKQGACEKPVQKQGGAGDCAAKAGKVTRRTHSASGAQVAKYEGEKPSTCGNCTGCTRKKECKKVARWNKVQKQAGGVVARKVPRRSRSVSTNIGRVASLEGPAKQVAKDKKVAKVVNRGQGSGKRKMDESSAPERRLEKNSNKRACIDTRVGFNKVAPVKGRSSTLGEEIKSLESERPVRSSARREVGSYWEKPVLKESLRCKYCKASFSAASKLNRHMEIDSTDDHHTVV